MADGEQQAAAGAQASPAILSVLPDALSPGLSLGDWSPAPCDREGDARGTAAALTLTQGPKVKKAASGCVVATGGGALAAGCVSGSLWTSAQGVTEVPAEVQAVGRCAQKGRSLAGGVAYTSTMLNKRTFLTMASTGLSRVVSRKPITSLPEKRDIECAAKRLGIQLAVEDVSVGPLPTSAGAGDGGDGSGGAGLGPEGGTGEKEAAIASVPPLRSVMEGALPSSLDLCGWEPNPTEPGDESGLDLALLLARNSRCRNGSMGCAVVSNGVLVAVGINSPFWGCVDSKKPPSDAHAEVNAIGDCVRRGVPVAGSSVYITMPPCRRCFQLLAASGVGRIVVRKPLIKQDAQEILPAVKQLGIEFVVIEDSDERREHIQRLVGAAKRRKLNAAGDDGEGQTAASDGACKESNGDAAER